MVNSFGPGYTATANETTTPPTQPAVLQATDSFFVPCNPANPASGTRIESDWLNLLVGNLRRFVRGSQSAEGSASYLALADAAARYASRGVFGTGGGTANAQTVTVIDTGTTGTVVAPQALFDGMIVEWVASVGNTGAATLAAWGLTAKNLRDRGGNALIGYEIVAGELCRARYVLGSDEFRLFGVDANRAAIATTSGTSQEYTNIPPWTREFELVMNACSVSGTSPMTIQLGDAGGYETSAYTTWGGALQASSAVVRYTVGFGLASALAATALTGRINFRLVDPTANTWFVMGQFGFVSNDTMGQVAGFKSLSQPLDRIRLTTEGGANTLDAGSMQLILKRT
jgi:hypothetical protein